MPSTHSLDNLKSYHHEASSFFAAELSLLKDVLPKITDDRLGKASVLLFSAGQTGEALLQLSQQTDKFTSELMMLARSFMEKIINFCYVNICDEKEYRAFILHPIYKHYHLAGGTNMLNGADFSKEGDDVRKEKQDKLKDLPIVQEALAMFSETKDNLTWTKKTLNQRLEAIENWGNLMDVFLTLCKMHYYSDASEALHGSLYGCTFNTGVFSPGFNHNDSEEINKKLYKDSTCVILHLGMLIHEAFTLIGYTSDIKEFWHHSYINRGNALNLLLHVLERKSVSVEALENEIDQAEMPET